MTGSQIIYLRIVFGILITLSIIATGASLFLRYDTNDEQERAWHKKFIAMAILACIAFMTIEFFLVGMSTDAPLPK